MIPYIHLFRTLNNYYFYDVNKDSVQCITEGIYKYLEKNKNIPHETELIRELNENDRKLLSDYIFKGFLSDHHAEKIEHIHTKDLEYQVKNRTGELILQVTQNCNLVCSYCPFANVTDGKYQRNHSLKKMDWDTARKGLDYFLDNSTEIDKIHIGFYGGEPLLNFPLVQQSVEYAEEIFTGKETGFSVTTNGTVMTDEIISFLNDHKFIITFSIDGPASVHDINRRMSDGSGSYDIAVKNMKKLFREKSENVTVKINMVINTENDFEEVFKLFDDPFFKNSEIEISVSLASTDKLENKPGYREDFIEKFNYNRFITIMNHFGAVKNLSSDPVSESFLTSQLYKTGKIKEKKSFLNNKCAPAGPCIPGQRRLFINADGNFYPCERVNELSEDLVIGNIRDGFDFNQAEKILNIARLTEEKCKKCYAFRHCTACALGSVYEKNFSAETRLSHCDNIKKDFSNRLRFIAFQREFESVYKRYI